MMHLFNRNNEFFFVLFFLSLMILFIFISPELLHYSHASGEGGKSRDMETVRIAVLPLVNICGSDVHAPDIIGRIEKILSNKNELEIIPDERVEEFLARERVRELDCLGRTTACRLGRALDADGILITCLNLLEPDENIMIGIGCRMLSSRDGSILWYNHLSLSGDDFTSWFGLKKIISLDVLTDRVVERLLQTFPRKIGRGAAGGCHVEIMRYSVTPSYLCSDENVEVQVEFAVMDNSVKDARVILNGVEIVLCAEEGAMFGGTFKAPGKEGKYFLNIEARDGGDKLYLFKSLDIIVVDNTPPDVTLHSSEKLFSPNGDKVRDYAIFTPYLNSSEVVKRWEFIIEDCDYHMIRIVEGENILPESIIWHGEDNFYSSVSDGRYFYSMRVIDMAGNETYTPKRMIVLDKTPPRIRTDVEIWKERGYKFKLNCEEMSGVDEWYLKIIDSNFYVVKEFQGSGDLPPSIWWETAEIFESGYSYSFKTRDIAGNRLVLKPVPLKGKIIESGENAGETEEENKKWNFEF